jgi:hypothetical protein
MAKPTKKSSQPNVVSIYPACIPVRRRWRGEVGGREEIQIEYIFIRLFHRLPYHSWVASLEFENRNKAKLEFSRFVGMHMERFVLLMETLKESGWAENVKLKRRTWLTNVHVKPLGIVKIRVLSAHKETLLQTLGFGEAYANWSDDQPLHHRS